MTTITPRYSAYCRAHGRDPESMLAHDRERFPGGKMAGFIVWLRREWSAFDDEHHGGKAPFARPEGEHDAFNYFLVQRYPARAA